MATVIDIGNPIVIDPHLIPPRRGRDRGGGGPPPLLGAGTPAGDLLGDELNGLAVSFTGNSALVRDTTPAFQWEDVFAYANEAALTVEWPTIVEGNSDPNSVLVPGDGTVVLYHPGVSTTYIAKSITTIPMGVYQVYIDIVAKIGTVAADTVINFGTAANNGTYASYNVGALPANPGVYQLIGTAILMPNAWVTLRILATSKGMTFGGIKLVRVSNAALTTPNSLLTYATTSPKMMYGVSGLLTHAPHNYQDQSEDLSTAVYRHPDMATYTANADIAPNGTMTADLFVGGPTGSPRLDQYDARYGLDEWMVVTWSCYVKQPAVNPAPTVKPTNMGNGATFTFATGTIVPEAAAIDSTAVNVGNGWWRISITVLKANGFGYFDTRIPVDTSLLIWGCQYNRGFLTEYVSTTTTTRAFLPIDYDPISHAIQGLLTEDQRVNLVLRSQEFANVLWIKAGSSIEANTTMSPEGALNADKIVESATMALHQMTQAITKAAAATVYTMSIYAKAAGRTGLRFMVQESGGLNGAYAEFNVSTGTVLTAASTYGTGWVANTQSIQSVGNGWYRCTLCFTSGVETSVVPLIRILETGAGTQGYTGNGIDGLYLWGLQLETLASPSSYIATTGSQVTRAGDIATSLSGALFPQTDGAFTVVWEGHGYPFDSNLGTGGSGAGAIILEGKVGQAAGTHYFAIGQGQTSTRVAQVEMGLRHENVPTSPATAFANNTFPWSVPKHIGATVNQSEVVTSTGVTNTSVAIVPSNTIPSGPGTFASLRVYTTSSGPVWHRNFIVLPRKITQAELEAKVFL